MSTVPLLQNIYHGFILLGENVRTTLQIQLGDIARLDEQPELHAIPRLCTTSMLL